MIELTIIMIFMIVASLAAVAMKGLLSSVIAVGAAGLALSVAFILLKAPDLAITQLVVEILILIILVRATLRREDQGLDMKGPREYPVAVVTLVFTLVFLSFAYQAVKLLPPFGEAMIRTSSRYLLDGLKETGAANLVTSVILDYRAYDTLGEASVLFTAVIGVLAVARAVGRKRKGKDS